MAVGRADRQLRFDDAAALLGERLAEGTIYQLLAGQGDRLFPDEYLADLYADSAKGRPTVPARVVCSVMLLQAHEGLSDREAVDRLAFDLRWKAAAGLAVDAGAFHPTVLVGVRNRLRASDRPRRLFEDVNGVARRAGLLRGRKRVIDSTPLYDAVSTQDTVTQLRAAIRKLLMVADRLGEGMLAGEVRSVLARDDDYAGPGKPPCDWDDPAAREALVDALVRDCRAVLGVLHGRALSGPLAEAATLLALVTGQDVEEGEDGIFRIARRVARDRIISTVDPEARHGHKSRKRTFDGYKTHLAADPDDELITEVGVTAANVPDRDAVDDLIAAEVLDNHQAESEQAESEQAERGFDIFGDSAYADADTFDRVGEAGHRLRAKVPPVRNRGGRFSKDDFDIDLGRGEATCPAGNTAPITPARGGGGKVAFGRFCGSCPLRERCTAAKAGRSVAIHRREATLQTARAVQKDPAWRQAYRANRPIAERKIAHFTRRAWGGRKARCRGTARILTDVLTRAAAVNLTRLATLGLNHAPTGWVVATG
ncbi:MAG TPA: IS1182 family transposase [Pseudonocardiaceae bacterium]|nr:IS1182 family transposase [Pseudonocardiaceae bacterium]